MRTNTIIPVLLTIFTITFCFAEDWPQWRGPKRDGICRETGLLKKWPEGGPELQWKIKTVGKGYSGPAIVGDVLYTMGTADNKDWVYALDLKNKGATLWKTPIGPEKYKGNFPGPRSTPTVCGDHLYVLGASGKLACLEKKGGKVVWSKEFVGNYGGIVPKWGFSESVFIDEDKLVCIPGGPRSSIVALNKKSGNTIWASRFGDKASYSSIIKVQHEGMDQYLTFTFDGVVGVSAKDGEMLWKYKEPAHRASWGNVNVMTPVWYKGAVFASSNYKTGGGAATIKKSGSGFRAEQLYFTKEMQNHHGGLVVIDGNLYGCSDPKNLKCMDFMTGRVKWETTECGKCSVLAADGMLFCRDEKGPICLVKISPEKFELLGKFDQPDRSKERAWPHLVIANGMMYVRDQDLLLCYRVKE